MPSRMGRDSGSHDEVGLGHAVRGYPSASKRMLPLLGRGLARGFVVGTAILVSGCGSSSGVATPLVPTASSSPMSDLTRAVPTFTPKASSSPAPQGAIAETQVASPFALAWLPNGDGIAVTTAGGLVFVGDENLSDHRQVPTDNPLEFLAVTREGNRLATTEAGTRFQLWSMPGPLLVAEQEITINDTFGVSFDDHGRLDVATESGGESLAVQGFTGDNVTNVTTSLFVGDGAVWIADIAIAPSGEFTAFNGFEGVELWRFEGLSPWNVLIGPRAAALRFSPDNTLLAAAHWDGVVRVWSIDSGEVAQSFAWGEEPELTGARTGVDFSPDGRVLAVAGHGAILVWDLDGQMIAHTLPIPSRSLNSISFSPDGTKLASIGEDGLLQIWAVGP